MEESIGAKLKQARELRRLTLQQVSESTKVRPHYLHALENDDLSAISSVAQARGFLRIYAEFLGLSPADLVPASRPPDPVTKDRSSGSIPENLPAASPKDIPHEKSGRRGVLANIFDRFKRPEVHESEQLQIKEPVISVEDSKTSPQRQFTPARVTEELPQIATPEVMSQPTEIKSEESSASPFKDATVKPRTSKRSSTKPRKPTAQVVEKDDVKKKADEYPQLRNG
jgi:transcriptional regulator with XRE-family HTH domain